MRAIATLTAAAALLALAGCERLGIGGGGDGAAQAQDTANASANASSGKDTPGEAPAEAQAQAAGAGGKDLAGGATPAAAGGATLDRAYVIGRWTDDGDCAAAAEFTADGRFVAANGNEGLWNLVGDRLTMTGSSTLTLQIVPIEQNVMNVVNPDGSLGRSTRC